MKREMRELMTAGRNTDGAGELRVVEGALMGRKVQERKDELCLDQIT